jgi:hypothetical protein
MAQRKKNKEQKTFFSHHQRTIPRGGTPSAESIVTVLNALEGFEKL